ncbi:uncharacterized protein LOC106668895 [Cimex lectularius]|uniref:Uncharacterized protein n=1 Tax=Cimex lectularius TaxID=79782 RepID=A0A8I6RW50_CIMLE|nr:uncharacterized protein LOC106668895 [Cimex lectularius]
MEALKERQSKTQPQDGPVDHEAKTDEKSCRGRESEVFEPLSVRDEKTVEEDCEQSHEEEVEELEEEIDEGPSSERDQGSDLKRKLADVEGGGDGDAVGGPQEPEPSFTEPAAKKKPGERKDKNLKRKKERKTRSKKQEKGEDSKKTVG